jgi:hypothetical protein
MCLSELHTLSWTNPPKASFTPIGIITDNAKITKNVIRIRSDPRFWQYVKFSKI